MHVLDYHHHSGLRRDMCSKVTQALVLFSETVNHRHLKHGFLALCCVSEHCNLSAIFLLIILPLQLFMAWIWTCLNKAKNNSMLDAPGMLVCHSNLDLTSNHRSRCLALALRGVLRAFWINGHWMCMLRGRHFQMPQPPKSICLA